MEINGFLNVLIFNVNFFTFIQYLFEISQEILLHLYKEYSSFKKLNNLSELACLLTNMNTIRI